MIITDFMPSIVPGHLTENKLIYNSKNQFSVKFIFLMLVNLLKKLIFMLILIFILLMNGLMNVNITLLKSLMNFDIIKYKEVQFGYNKKFLTNMYYTERHSARRIEQVLIFIKDII